MPPAAHEPSVSLLPSPSEHAWLQHRCQLHSWALDACPTHCPGVSKPGGEGAGPGRPSRTWQMLFCGTLIQCLAFHSPDSPGRWQGRGRRCPLEGETEEQLVPGHRAPGGGPASCPVGRVIRSPGRMGRRRESLPTVGTCPGGCGFSLGAGPGEAERQGRAGPACGWAPSVQRAGRACLTRPQTRFPVFPASSAALRCTRLPLAGWKVIRDVDPEPHYREHTAERPPRGA